MQQEKESAQVSVKPKELKSKYIGNMIKTAKRREVEQNAAWEKMEALERQREIDKGLAAGETEKFVTSSYKKQLELNKEAQLLAEAEERLNEKKTANADTGMMGFYKMLNKTTDKGAEQAEKTEDAMPKVKEQSTRDKLENSLALLK